MEKGYLQYYITLGPTWEFHLQLLHFHKMGNEFGDFQALGTKILCLDTTTFKENWNVLPTRILSLALCNLCFMLFYPQIYNKKKWI